MADSKSRTVLLEGYNNDYSVSENGDVYSHKFGKTKKLKPVKTTTGDYKVTLTLRGKQKVVKVQLLVATTFIPNPENKRLLLFKDGDKSHHFKSNLAWSTFSELRRYYRDHGLLDSKTCQITRPKAIAIKRELMYNKKRTEKLSIGQIAAKFKVGYHLVANIKNNRSWANLEIIKY